MAEIKDIRHEADKKDGSYADIARKMGRVPGTVRKYPQENFSPELNEPR